MTMTLVRRCLSTAGAASTSAAAAATAVSASSAPSFPPPSLASSRPSVLLEAYVNQPLPPAPEPDNAWKRDMFSTMAYSPQRECAVTKANLPSAFMVNFRLAEDGKEVLPDRLEHPKFKRRRTGRSFWAALHRDAVESLQAPRGNHLRYLRRIWGDVNVGPEATRIVEEGVLERTVQEATLLAEALAGDEGQRHILSLSEVERKGPRLQPTEDGEIVAILDLRLTSEPGAKLERDSKPTPLVAEDLSSLATDGMLKRHGGVPSIPFFRLREEYGDRATELEKLLRSVKDEDVLILQAPHFGEPLSVPLAIALWRRLLFTGRGWKRTTRAK